jgi:hypothetical protein
MVMKENEDNLLIADFFAEHKQEVHDRGFTKEVMKKVERKNSYLLKFTTFMGYALAIVLFFSLDGWNKLLSVLNISVENGWNNIKDTLGIAQLFNFKEWNLNVFIIVAMVFSFAVVIGILIGNSRTRSALSKLFT